MPPPIYAQIYSVRPRPRAPVSTPVTWQEIEKGVRIEDFRIDNVRRRIATRGDVWQPLLSARGRVDLGKFMTPEVARTGRTPRPTN
jgi:bifunctional non-homologous end joining protein LigD